LPCLLGYGVLAEQLHKDPRSKRGESNLYWTWIANYVADDYVKAVKTGSGKYCTSKSLAGSLEYWWLTKSGKGLIERHAVQQSALRIEELVKIFIHATKVS